MSEGRGETADAALTVDGLETALHCPRRYAFAHVHELAGEDDGSGTDDRVDVLRRAICDALRTAPPERTPLLEAGRDRLEARWADHDERFHSMAQRRHERRVLEATLEAYVDAVGVEHAAGIDRLDDESAGGELIGPALPLSSTVSLPVDAGPETGGSTAPEAVTVRAPVDYVTGDDSSIVGVRFVPTLAPYGLVRYRSEWAGDVASEFVDHFDDDATTFEPSFVAALFETAVVLDGLRERCERLGLADRTCRYVLVPLAERSRTSVNWVQDTVDASLEPLDLTDRYVDHHTFGMTHEHRNRTVDDRLAAVLADVTTGGYDPADRWDAIARESCPDCAYAVCCDDYVAREVRFDG